MSLHPCLRGQLPLTCPYCNRTKNISFSLKNEAAQLKCPNCSKKYPILQGVPILADDVAEDVLSVSNIDKTTSYEEFASRYASLSERVKFYYEHYPPTKDREAYLKSTYLASEKKFIKEFIKVQNITGYCLEIGCAAGQFADISDNYIGLEYSLSSVFAKGFENYGRLVASAESIPLADKSVELVFSFNTLEHIPNPDLAFQEIDRILMPNGWAVLKPAWHCTKYNTELLPIKPYSELRLYHKIKKFILPLLRAKPYKFLTRIPIRLMRRISYMISKSPTKLRYRKLIPYLGQNLGISDADATADIDCHEGLLYFESRGYELISHPTLTSRLLAGNDIIVLRKPK